MCTAELYTLALSDTTVWIATQSGDIDMRALVTGATGFVGYHVTKALVEQGIQVSVLVRPTSDLSALAEMPVKPIVGSLADEPALGRSVRDMDLLFHVAADYRLWVPNYRAMHDVNVTGTIRLLRAASAAGVSRIVYTSSAVTVACNDGRPGTESDFMPLGSCRSAYQRTKVVAEQAVWRLIEEGAPITIVNPSTPIGSHDRRPTPTGKLIVDFLNQRLPAYLDARFNWVSVEDVAAGHWLAAVKGRIGDRYILGNQNWTLGQFLSLLAEVSDLPAPRTRIPYSVAYAAGMIGEAIAKLSRREPRASLDGVRMARDPMQYDSSKAVRELGFSQSSVRYAVKEAVQWFREHGYVQKGKGR